MKPMSRLALTVCGLALGSLALAGFVPLRADSYGCYALTNGGSDMRDSTQTDLTGLPSYSFLYTASNSSGAESAWSREEATIDAGKVWTKASSGGVSRSSASSGATMRFQVQNETVYNLNWEVSFQSVVWWDSAMVRLIDHTGQFEVARFDANGSGSAQFTLDPTRVYSVSVSTNHNNLSWWSYPAADKNYLAEATLTPVPEPAALAALSLGVLAFLRRRR